MVIPISGLMVMLSLQTHTTATIAMYGPVQSHLKMVNHVVFAILTSTNGSIYQTIILTHKNSGVNCIINRTVK